MKQSEHPQTNQISKEVNGNLAISPDEAAKTKPRSHLTLLNGGDTEIEGERPNAATHNRDFDTANRSSPSGEEKSTASRHQSDESIPLVLDALKDLQRYLSDSIAPMLIADSMELLLLRSPHLVAAEIRTWTIEQYRRHASASLSDYLFHAFKKIHLLGEFGLVEKNLLTVYLGQLAQHLLPYCPPADREQFCENINHLGESQHILAAPVEYLHRQSGGVNQIVKGNAVGASAAGDASSASSSAAAPANNASSSGATLSAESEQNLRRLSELINLLQQQVAPAGKPAQHVQQNELVAEAFARAATSSQNDQELALHLQRMRALGVEVKTEDVFQSLSRNLAQQLATGAAAAKASACDSDSPVEIPTLDEPAEDAAADPLEAMKRMVTLAEKPEESAKRFAQMIETAIGQFNSNSLESAVAIFDGAERLAAEKKIDTYLIKRLRREDHDKLNHAQLRRYAERTDQRPLLRKVLHFFEAFAPQTLFEELKFEDVRERRRLLISLLEVLGTPARDVALRALVAASADESDWYFTRNLLYLLRLIPREDIAVGEEELTALIRLSEPQQPLQIVREAIANLEQIIHPKAEKALITRLGDFEEMLLKPERNSYDPVDTQSLLDRTVAALARFPTDKARWAILKHGLQKHVQFGDTIGRLSEFAHQDLADNEKLTERLLSLLKEELPYKVFGFTLKKSDRNAIHLVRALSATTAPAVRQLFEEIAKKFSDRELGRVAAASLSRREEGAAAGADNSAAPSRLSGDLKYFGLPTVLQNLADSQATGVLTLIDSYGDETGRISLCAGKIQNCIAAHVRNLEAIYQLLERPPQGTFSFAQKSADETAIDALGDDDGNGGEFDLFGVLLEGMRRFDEFTLACEMVGDDALLGPTNVKPTTHPEEQDAQLVEVVWNKVTSGLPAGELEKEIPVDTYRIRRLLAHWVEEKSLARI